MNKLTVPITEEQIRALKVGDVVSINGTILTARDAAHKYMIDEWLDKEPEGEEATIKSTLAPMIDGGVIYHCGPVVRKDDEGKWHFVAAGPTTSIREEPYEHRVIGELGLRAVIGKCGMAGKTLAACKEHGAVYLHAIGGAASLIAKCVEEVEDVYKIEFGLPEAFWQIRVKDFQCVVTMDSHGNSLHDDILENSRQKFNEMMGL